MHSIDFFRDEVRNGFYIPTAIKQSWACSLDVLAEIDRICVKHDIQYFADWGTLLGAVRHGGFVPWDDDIDICMKRDDYIKFRAVADNELPSEYVIHDYERQKNHWLFLSRVVNSSKYGFNEDYLDKNYNFPWLSGIDIFVKDYLYKDSKKEKKRCNEIMRTLATAELSIDKGDDRSAIALYKKAEQQMARVPKDESESVGQIFPWILKGQSGEPKAYYEKSVRLPFEDTTIPVPSHYNELLQRRYGNYLEVRKVWDGHKYPAFDNQRESFENATGEKLPSFTFSPSLFEKPERNKHYDIRKEHRTILFLPIGPKEWAGFENTYKKESASPDTDVFLMPIPLLFKDYFGRIKMPDEEIVNATKTANYPANLPIISWLDTDLEKFNPDIIYIQSPYDDKNPVLTIPEYFFSKNLIQLTKKLVYIPIAKTSEFTNIDVTDQVNLKFYVTMPALFYADEVWVQSENIKKQYINKLISFSGENTLQYWDAKIKTVPDLYDQTP